MDLEVNFTGNQCWSLLCFLLEALDLCCLGCAMEYGSVPKCTVVVLCSFYRQRASASFDNSLISADHQPGRRLC